MQETSLRVRAGQTAASDGSRDNRTCARLPLELAGLLVVLLLPTGQDRADPSLASWVSYEASCMRGASQRSVTRSGTQEYAVGVRRQRQVHHVRFLGRTCAVQSKFQNQTAFKHDAVLQLLGNSSKKPFEYDQLPTSCESRMRG